MKHESVRSVEKRVVVGVTCDGCQKRVDGSNPEGWYSFWSAHNDWGNDSIDSDEDWDACSWACYLAVVARVVNEYGDDRYPTLTVDHKDLPFLKQMLENMKGENERS